MLAQFQKAHPEDVQIVFRQFPLPSHALSLLAAAASEAAGKQGEFFPMMEAIFAGQSTWAQMDEAALTAWLENEAKTLGLDLAKFKEDMQSQEVKDKLLADQQNGIDVQIPGTPFVMLNGLHYNGSTDLQTLESLLKLFQMGERQYTACPPVEIKPGKQYVATIQTEKGDIKVELLEDEAPLAVNSFVFLARNGWFDGVTFHRVLQGFMAQSGDPSGTGIGGPGYIFANETSDDLKFDSEGLLAMANAGADTNGSQFFITFDAAETLNGGYTIFGKVIEGMDVVNQITLRDPQNNPTAPLGDLIKTITIEEK